MIPVTKPFLPSRKRFDKYLDDVYKTRFLTNGGPLYQALTERLCDYLGVENLLLLSNGTIALQIAMRALGVSSGDRALTTPFSFAATSSSLAWEGVRQAFVDIDPLSFNMSASNLSSTNQQSKLLMAVHVFGNPCENALDEYARVNNKALLYDAAHAFGVKENGRSVLQRGDAATLSFHATKLFHTVEGGAAIFKSSDVLEQAKQLINFGLDSNGIPQQVGINGKLSEVHCAMGLAVLDEIDIALEQRQSIKNLYHAKLEGYVDFQQWNDDVNDNTAYMPVLLPDEETLLAVVSILNENDIYPRRYFYPSLNTVSAYLSSDCEPCPVAEDVASRILCLPLYPDLPNADVERICDLVKRVLD